MSKFAIAIHGGAGTILRSAMSIKKEGDYKKGLEEAINAGTEILSAGGHSVDAVEAAIKIMEDNPLFNAGKGSVFTHDGKNEMDACIMNGKNLKAGAVAAVRNIKNPISLARGVMEKSVHVFLASTGAMEFAKKLNMDYTPDEYFFVQQRYDQYLKAKESDVIITDHDATFLENKEKKYGTVGAVCLDIYGNIAAGTSTGGMTNKRLGRIGDSPMIGAGTYANNNTCAVSCTGHGEFFILSVVAYDISCLIEYKGLSLQEASDFVIYKKLVEIGGSGGLIAVDAKGNIAMPFNSFGMYRAMKKSDEELYIGIYKD
ncbi:MAG: isoaspartyl peptidase/L-asparaginase [Bacteroidetes bacterium]|nr:isoaspartyl peptidase/L-asparaginase [Bacteroidota bacterium]